MTKKKIAIVFLTLIMLISQIFVFPVSADSASVSAPSTAYLGDTITVTVTFECTNGSKKIGAVDADITFDDTVLQCTSSPKGSNLIGKGKYHFSWYEEGLGGSSKKSVTFKFKTLKAGKAGIHVDAQITDTEITKTEEKEYNTSINVIDKSTLSGNAKASQIILSAGKLVPAFSPDVTSYNVNIDYSVTEVLLSVTTQEAKAQISIVGSKTMKVGSNTRTVVITAPNGTVKKYTINIYRAASGETVTEPEPPVTEPTVNPYEITVNGKNMLMASDYTDVAVPYGFSPVAHTINDAEVPVLRDVVNDRIIVYATDENGENGAYCLYNEEEKTFSLFRYMGAEGLKFIVLDYKDAVPTLKNYFYTSVSVGEYSVNGFKYSDSAMADFVIFYGESMDGEKGFYRYDTEYKTVQRAVEFSAEYNNAITTDDKDVKDVIARFMELELKNKIIVISGAAVILLIIVLVIIIIVKISHKSTMVTAESLEAASEQEFMDGFGENTFLFLDDDYENDDLTLDDDFKLKDNDQE